MILGIILDVSNKQIKDKRLIDYIKSDLIKLIKKSDADEEYYIYNPNSFDIHYYNKGKQIAEVANFEPYNINVDLAIKQTLYILANEDYPKKVVLYISDRFNANNEGRIDRIFKINESNRFYCDFLFLEIEKFSNLQNEYLVKREIDQYEEGLIFDIFKDFNE